MPGCPPLRKPISLKQIFRLFDFKQAVDYKTEILSGLTVAIALVPEAVAFALIAGLAPLVGLYAAFTMGLVTSLLGGRPGMISGATGAVVLAGLLQILAGLLRLGKLMRLVPLPVVYGFVNGLAIIIFLSQLEQFKDASGAWLTGPSLYLLLGLVLLTMAIIWGLPRLTKAFPASLAGAFEKDLLQFDQYVYPGAGFVAAAQNVPFLKFDCLASSPGRS